MKIEAILLVASMAVVTSAIADDPNLRRHSTHIAPSMTAIMEADNNGSSPMHMRAGMDTRSYIDPTANRYGDGAPDVTPSLPGLY